MTATVSRQDAPARLGDGQALLIFLVAVGAGVVALQAETIGRGVIGVLGLVVFVLVALSGRTLAVTMIIVWLVMLGFTRRFLIPFAGWSPQDPLLLVSPAAAIVFWQSGIRAAGRPLPRTLLSSLAAFLLLLTAAQVFNPNEQSVRVALEGSITYVVPLLWFFAGRTFDKRIHTRVLDATFWMTIPVVALGLYHVFVGFFPFELTWLSVGGPGPAIFLPGFRIRPFSTLTSPQEYGVFLLFGVVAITIKLLHARRHRLWLLAYLGVTLVTLFLQGSRGTAIGCFLAVTVVLVVHTRSAAVLFALMGLVLGLALLVPRPTDAGLNQRQVRDEHNRTGSVRVILDHQIRGLTDPGNSTAPIHLDLFFGRIIDGIRNPLGLGVSTGSIASAKAGADNAVSGESDIANVTAGLGVLGGLALVWFVIVGIAGARRVYLDRPSALHLFWIGILVGGITQWLNGSLYATSTILFIALGGISRELSLRRLEVPDRALVRA